MSNNKYIQALIIAATAFVASLIPVAGNCLGCVSIIALFLYFSKLHAAADNNYGIGAGIKFGLIYAVVGTGFALVISVIMGDFLVSRVIQEMEQSAQSTGGAGMGEFIDILTDLSSSQITFYYTLMSLVGGLLIGVILGLVSGLIFSKDEDDD